MFSPLLKNSTKINLDNSGLFLFRLGVFFLPSAFFVSAILFLISLILSLIKDSSKLIDDKWNYLFFTSSIFMVISSLVHLHDFSDKQEFIFESKEIVWEAGQSLVGLGNWLPFFFCFIGFQNYLSTSRNRRICAQLLISGSIPVLITGFGQFWFDWHGPISFLNEFIIWFQRPLYEGQGLSGLFNNQNYAGSWLNIIWPFSLALIFEKKSNIFNQTIVITIGMAVSVAIFLTYSRSAWAGFLLSSFFLLGQNIFIVLILSTIAIVLTTKLIPYILNEWGLNNGSNLEDNFNILKQFDPLQYHHDSQRITIFNFALKYISLRPLTGWGAAIFYLFYLSKTNTYIGHPHNLFLEVAFSYGILASLSIFINIILICFFSYKTIFSKKSNSNINRFEKVLDQAWWISFFVLLCTQMVDIQYFDGRISLAFWILLAGMRETMRNNSFEE